MKILKNIILLILVAIPAGYISAQETFTSKTVIQKGEKWWGVNPDGVPGPLDGSFAIRTDGYPASARPVLLSNNGRYIWSDHPMEIGFDGKTITITSSSEKVSAVKAGKDLREAYLVWKHKHLPPDGNIPDISFFIKPQYDLSIELGFSQDQRSVLQYASSLISNGYLPGIITLPEGWRNYNCGYDFNKEIYPDPASMIQSLKEMGFNTLVTISPYTPAFGKEYVEGLKKGWFLRDSNGDPVIIDTKGGKAVCYDVSESYQMQQIRDGIDRLIKDVEIDGFVFDCLDAMSYLLQDSVKAGAFMANWSGLSSFMKMSEHTSIFESFIKSSTLPNFGDFSIIKEKTPEQIRELRTKAIYEAISAGIKGHPYCRVHIPVDMAAVLSSEKSMAKYLQLEAAMPAMKVAFSPMRISDPDLSKEVKWGINHRLLMADYIHDLMMESVSTAEPLIRHMEYQFPRSGFSDCNDQFMLGPKYLIAPDIEGTGKRMVRIPKGTWTDRNGRKFKGPQVTEISCPGFQAVILELSGK